MSRMSVSALPTRGRPLGIGGPGWLQPVVERFYGKEPGDDGTLLEWLLWARRGWFRIVGLVFSMVVALVVAQGGQLGWFLFFIVLGVFGMALFEIVRLSVAIRRERR